MLNLAQVTNIKKNQIENVSFGISYPRIDTFNPHHFWVDGWIYSSIQKVEKLELIALTSPDTTYTIEVNRQRPDILKRLGVDPNQYKQSVGFHAILDISALLKEESVPLVLKVVLENGSQQILSFNLEQKCCESDDLFPDFIVAGTMKGGTTALYDYICRHPKVRQRDPKEIHYFTLKFEQGLNWYKSFFYAERDIFVGESSPSYFDFSLAQPEIVRRIREFFPRTKVIIILRHPTDRAISHFYHDKFRLKTQKSDIEDFFSADNFKAIRNHPYIETGKYIERLEIWKSIFPKDSLLVLQSEKLMENTSFSMQEVLDFLGLDAQTFPFESLEAVYANKYQKPSSEIINRLDQHYAPQIKRLKEIWGIDFDR